MPASLTTQQALRGLGKDAYRAKLNASQAVTFAISKLGRDLSAAERRTVMAGWATERREQAADRIGGAVGL